MTLIPFAEELEYSAIAELVRSNDSVIEAHATIINSFNAWWEEGGKEQILHLRQEEALLYSTAEDMKSAFVVALEENEILDDFAIRGAFVEWFNINESTLRTIIETGFPAALIDDDNVLALEHQTLLDQRNQLITQTDDINTQYDLLGRINRSNKNSSDDEADEGSDSEAEGISDQIGDFITNTVLEPLEAEKSTCTTRIRELTSECKDIHHQLFDRDEVKTLSKELRPGKARTFPAANNLHKLDDLISSIEGIATLDEMRNLLVTKIAEWETLCTRKNEIVDIMKPHEDYKTRRNDLNGSFEALKEQLYILANEVRKTLPEEFVITEVTNHLRASLRFQLQRRLDANVTGLISLIQSMYERYARTLSEIRLERDELSTTVDALFIQLGYLEEI